MGLRTRSILSLGATLIIGGAILCFGAYALGVDTSVTWNNLSIGTHGVTFVNRDYNSADYTKVSQELEFFNKVTLELDSMDLEIKRGDTYKIEAAYYKDNTFSYEVKNGELTIDQDAEQHFLFGFNNKIGKVTLYIPEGKNLVNMDVNLGIGETLIENVTTDSLELKGGVGEINIKNLISNDTNAKIGVGELHLQGDLRGETTIKGGIGEISLELVGGEKEYNYDIKKGIGEVRINNRSHGGFGDTKENNNAANEISIKSGIGEITIKTN